MTGAEFKQRRDRALGWTQKDASEALGITIAQVSGIENGRSRVTRTIEILLGMYQPGDRPGRPSANWPKN